jgi:hypothetical protein
LAPGLRAIPDVGFLVLEATVWVDDEGVYHTVALPDPTVLMSEPFRESLDRLLATTHDEVAKAIETEEMRFYAGGPGSRGKDNEAEFVGVAPPEMLTEPVRSIADLVSLLGGLDDRWRLDALAALDDYVS